jgi:kynureninase
LRLIPARHELLEEEDIWACLDERVALLWLPTVLYRSGQLLEVGRWTAEAHRVGALAGWDAAHSVGALPHAFHAQEVDFAVWCHYKYVAAGPGAPAGLFVHRKHAGALPGLPGWWGSDKASQFAMATPMSPAAGAGRFQQGTPSVLALAALRAALRVLAQVDLAEVRASSLRLTSLLIDLIDRYLPECALITPRDPERRGGHVTLRHSRARVLGEQLREDGVIPDVRPPDLLRLAPFPLQTEPAELERAVLAIRSRLDRAEWDRPELSQVP